MPMMQVSFELRSVPISFCFPPIHVAGSVEIGMKSPCVKFLHASPKTVVTCVQASVYEERTRDWPSYSRVAEMRVVGEHREAVYECAAVQLSIHFECFP